MLFKPETTCPSHFKYFSSGVVSTNAHQRLSAADQHFQNYLTISIRWFALVDLSMNSSFNSPPYLLLLSSLAWAVYHFTSSRWAPSTLKPTLKVGIIKPIQSQAFSNFIFASKLKASFLVFLNSTILKVVLPRPPTEPLRWWSTFPEFFYSYKVTGIDENIFKYELLSSSLHIF